MAREAYPEAATLYHGALALPGPPAELLNELAQVQVARHRFAAAEAIIDRLIAAEPRKVAWRVTLAQAAQERGDLEAARERWTEVLGLDGKHLRHG